MPRVKGGVSVFLSGGPNREGTSVQIETRRSQLGYWLGRGGSPLTRAEDIIHRHGKEATQEAIDLYHDQVVRTMPKRTGASAKSVQKEVSREGDKFVGAVFSRYFVVKIIEDGSGIYGPERRMIRPTTGKFLRFPSRSRGGFRLDDTPRILRGAVSPDAQWVFKRAVRGSRGRHIFRNALRDLRPEIKFIYSRHARMAALEIAAL